MDKRKRRLPKSVIAIIVTACLAVVLISAILIVNVFIPIRYLSAYLVKREKCAEGEMRVTFIDVGFGDCSLIELPDGKTVLIDGGNGDYGTTLNVLKTLNSRGVDRVDCLICSSVKREHCGGLEEIVKYKEVGYAFIPYCINTRITEEYHAFKAMLEKRGVDLGYSGVGEGLNGENYDYFLTFLSPLDYENKNSEYGVLNTSPNAATIENASTVTWLQYGSDCFIFTSDARATTLKRISNDYLACKSVGLSYCPFENRQVELEKCSVVTVPAHGGEDNTYAPWYDLISPERAIISVGESFAEYPSLQAVADVSSVCEPLYTAYEGNITVISSGSGYRVEKSK